ncbi:small secreted protein [Streptomyces sp. H10-C2]|uniref:small secreted protein n=1 Tax=Streptomyces sp. H10-C2 TaxID=3046210 RepID=UPI0024B8F6B7|nr:small secreted protein [Streptomyces sp. H10-C2]MDJ0374844.1 small secreted protein [Streptomyces sp. H10-C2]
MNKKLLAALSGAALLLALSGCSSDNSNKKLDAWAKTVCDQASAQTKKINDANTAITKVDKNGKPADVKAADSAAFQQISDAYKSLADIVSKAGAPPVDKGADQQKNSIADLTKASAAYAAVKSKVDGLDAGDQAKFADGLTAASVEADKANKTAEAALNTLRNGDVGKAMSSQQGCQQTGASPSKT